MERAARFLAKLRTDAVPAEELVRAAWPLAVGRRLAERCQFRGYNGKTVVVEVEDELWRRNLMSLSRQIKANLRDRLGEMPLEGIEVRLGIPRRLPARAETARPLDDAEAITDPILGAIYRAARRRSTA
ncbi:MAG: DUF721 domain-containing protein [Acidobacteria bacterium]|nr:DUF721 domain-containing protein [Acidobacteriota bacterium]